MPIGTAMIVAKEAAKKAIKETAKQVAKEAKKDALKGKIKDAVKQEIKEEVKGKVKEEIDENIVDTKVIDKISLLSKSGTLKEKLQESLKSEIKEEVRERVMEDVDDNLVDTKAVQVVSRGAEVFKPERKPETHEMKEKTEGTSEKEESLKDKLDHAISNPSETDVKREGETDIGDKPEKYESNSYVTIDGERYRTDDNGNIYQKRNLETGTYECLPNTQYELNGYSYETDSSERIVHAGGTLKEKNHEGRPTINDNVYGMKDTDEKGHLIGDQFEGSNLNGNLVAMDFDVNRSDYKKLEEKLAKYVNEDHKTTTVSIDVKYDGESSRPSGFIVKYTVDGETFKEKFNN